MSLTPRIDPLDLPALSGTLGTITWTGTAPSGTVTKTWTCLISNKTVTFNWRIVASIAGSGNSRVFFDLPAECPTPANLILNEFSYLGIGEISTGVQASLLGGASGLYSVTPTVYTYTNNAASIAAVMAIGSITYDIN